MKKIIVVLAFLIVAQYFLKNNQINDLRIQLTEKQKKIDSLTDALYPVEIELTRYQITLEKLKETDSICSSTFQTTMEMETE